MGVPDGSDGKEYACNAGDLGSVPGLGRSSAEGNGNPLQCPCLENPMDGGAWQAAVHDLFLDFTSESKFFFELLFVGKYNKRLCQNVNFWLSLFILLFYEF